MGCDLSPACSIAPIPLERLAPPRYGDLAVGYKARAFPARGEIWIDPAFWAQLRYADGRLAILCHEWAHLEGARCEPCADRRAGEHMRELGFPTARDARRTMLAELRFRDPARAERELAEGFGLDGGLAADGPPKVWHRENAAGVRPELQALLDAWEAEGPFPITVSDTGGVRWSQVVQAQLAASGVSAATTLEATPHGRAAALDVYPAWLQKRSDGTWYQAGIYLPGTSPDGKPVPPEFIRPDMFATWGAFAKSRGLVWGGDWRNKDMPHVELRNWRSLPMPSLPRGSTAVEAIGGGALVLLAAALAFLALGGGR